MDEGLAGLVFLALGLVCTGATFFAYLAAIAYANRWLHRGVAGRIQAQFEGWAKANGYHVVRQERPVEGPWKIVRWFIFPAAIPWTVRPGFSLLVSVHVYTTRATVVDPNGLVRHGRFECRGWAFPFTKTFEGAWHEDELPPPGPPGAYADHPLRDRWVDE